MISSLSELCNLIANQGIEHAKNLSSIFQNIAQEKVGRKIDSKESIIIFKAFSFLNWAYSNGIWSNLSNTKLRRDLMSESMKSIVLRTAYELSENKQNESVAMFAVDLDQEFRDFAMDYNNRLKELGRSEHEPDANSVLFYGLEGIQKKIGLDDSDMELIVPAFLEQSGDFAEIESIANQVNLASAERKKKGFFSRLFSS